MHANKLVCSERSGKTSVFLEDGQEWLVKNENDPGYQLLSDSEIVAEMVGEQESSSSSSDEDDTINLPNYWRCVYVLTVFCYTWDTSRIRISERIIQITAFFAEAVIREQYHSNKQLTLDAIFKAVTASTGQPTSFTSCPQEELFYSPSQICSVSLELESSDDTEQSSKIPLHQPKYR
ncbi:hypothetical protein SK128_004548 [Halocaridina rubra]|uniref:Uncharacterized protein n=1 Tax=Halocaridina rubra TaxID=373956 RepID=A0AAN8WEL1_HALRR